MTTSEENPPLSEKEEQDMMHLYKLMMDKAKFMRPELTMAQVDEAIIRTFKELEHDEDIDVVIRLEFHADDVLGYGDDEYAFPKKVKKND
jgi:hypothetical protein